MGTAAEVERLLRLTVRAAVAGPDDVATGKVALLRQAAGVNLPPAALGRAVAAVVDHPWTLTLAGCATVGDLAQVWPVVAAAGSVRNTAALHVHSANRIVLVRSTVDGTTPHLIEDLFVAGMVTGLLERSLPVRAAHRLVTDGPEERRWEFRLDPGRRPPLFSRWGAAGATSSALRDVLATVPGGDVAAAAGHLGLSRRTLQRRLADEGTSFQEVRSRQRLASAARAVLQDRTNLTRAAHDAGFSDSAHLSREFRRLVGVRADDWRQLSLHRSGRLARSFKPACPEGA